MTPKFTDPAVKLHWLEDPRQGLASFESIEPGDPAGLDAAVRASRLRRARPSSQATGGGVKRFGFCLSRSRGARALADGTSFSLLPGPLRAARLSGRLAASPRSS